MAGEPGCGGRKGAPGGACLGPTASAEVAGEGGGARGRQENWGRAFPSGQRDPQTPQWERLGLRRPQKEDLPLECREQGAGGQAHREEAGLWVISTCRPRTLAFIS